MQARAVDVVLVTGLDAPGLTVGRAEEHRVQAVLAQRGADAAAGPLADDAAVRARRRCLRLGLAKEADESRRQLPRAGQW